MGRNKTSMAVSTSAVRTRNAKIRRNQRKSAAKKLRKTRLGFIPMVSLAIIITLFSIHLWNNKIKIDQKSEQIAALKDELNHRRINNEALEQKVKSSVDDEYIAEIAKDNGYRKSDEVIFYLNGGD